MNKRSFLRLLVLSVFAALLGLGSPAHADNPLFNDAETALHQALNPGGDAPSVGDRTKLVKSALDSLQQVPMGGYHGKLKNAITFCKSALDVLGKGDPDNKASGYIRQAYDEVRDLTN
jgi:hypothetical protein